MASKDFILNVIANIADYQKKLGQIPGFTEKQAAAAAKKFADQQTKMLTASEQKTKKAADKAVSSLSSVDKVVQGLGYQTNDIKDLAEGFSGLAAAGGPAAAALILATTAVAGVTIAAVAGTSAIVGLVAAADDLAKELEYLKNVEGVEFISDSELNTIKDANAAMKALLDVGKLIALDLAAEFAPAVQLAFEELVRLGIAGERLAQNFTETYNVLREFAVAGLGILYRNLIASVPVIGQLAFALNKVNKAITGKDYLGEFADQLAENGVAALETAAAMVDTAKIFGVSDDEVQARIKAARSELAKSERGSKAAAAATRDLAAAQAELARITADANESMLSDEQKLQRAAFDRIKRIQELYQVTGDLEAAEKAVAAVRADLGRELAQLRQKEFIAQQKAAADQAKEEARQMDAMVRQLNAGVSAGASQLAELQRANKAAIDSLVQSAQQLVSNVFDGVLSGISQSIDKLDEKRQTVFDAYLTDIDRLEAAQADALARGDQDALKSLASQRAAKEANYRAELERIDREKEAKRKAALAIYAVEKALALTSIALNTAANIVKAGLNPIAIAAAVASGAAQAAAVLATPPPSFHSGGMVLADDEKLIRAKAGEFVLSTTGVRAAGGEENLRRLNRGQQTAQPMVVQMVYNHRVFEAFVQDNIKMNGALGRSSRAGRYSGRNPASYKKAI